MSSNAKRRNILGKSASVNLEEKYLFGTDGERANRIGTGYPPGADPADNAPEFKQIPGELTGKNANEPTLGTRSGHMKFSNFKG